VLTSGRTIYLDSSALVKLVVREPEFNTLHSYLRNWHIRASSELALVEVVRAVRRRGQEAVHLAHDVMKGVNLVQMERPLLETAARLDPIPLRSLDAIHIAAALTLGEVLSEIVTYDNRMADAARAVGLRVVMPGRD